MRLDCGHHHVRTIPQSCLTLYPYTLLSSDNYPEPGKRPLSSTTPTIIEHQDGSFYLAIGAAGGSLIFGAVLQVILGLNEWGLDVSQAIEYGRVHDQLYPSMTAVDSSIPDDIVEGLRERHHNITST